MVNHQAAEPAGAAGAPERSSEGAAPPRLYRSRRERMLAGVAGGLAQYFGIDPVLVRLGFVLLTLGSGAGLIGYIVLAVVVPERPAVDAEPPAPAQARGLRGSPAAGAVLIGLGVLFLLMNFGVLRWVDWHRIWPVFLILGGLALLGKGRRGRRAAPDWSQPRWAVPPAGAAVSGAAVARLEEDLGQAREATVELRHGAGLLHIGALAPESSRLIEADLAHGENVTIDRAIERGEDATVVRISGRASGASLRSLADGWRSDWRVALSPLIPLALRVRTGASDAKLDLRLLALRRLDVEAGASSLDITLPQTAGFTEARIQAGAAGVDITVPPGVAARIRTRSGLSGADIDRARFPLTDGAYQSPDYATAANRVDLDIETGVSGLTVR